MVSLEKQAREIFLSHLNEGMDIYSQSNDTKVEYQEQLNKIERLMKKQKLSTKDGMMYQQASKYCGLLLGCNVVGLVFVPNLQAFCVPMILCMGTGIYCKAKAQMIQKIFLKQEQLKIAIETEKQKQLVTLDSLLEEQRIYMESMEKPFLGVNKRLVKKERM